MPAPFIIYALPRSRTAWLSRFLTYGAWICYHEVAITMRSIADVKDFFSLSHVGTVETAAAQGWWLPHHHVPNLKAVVIRRPVEEVIQSMMRVDLRGVAAYDEKVLRRNMEYGDRMLRQISAAGAPTFSYDDLNKEDVCASIFQHCLGYELTHDWWLETATRNTQVDVPTVLTYYQQNKNAVEDFKRQCKAELRRLAYDGLIRKAA